MYRSDVHDQSRVNAIMLRTVSSSSVGNHYANSFASLNFPSLLPPGVGDTADVETTCVKCFVQKRSLFNRFILSDGAAIFMGYNV